MCQAPPPTKSNSSMNNRFMSKKRVRFNVSTTTTQPDSNRTIGLREGVFPNKRNTGRWYSASCLQRIRRDNQTVLKSLSSSDDVTHPTTPCLRGLELFTPNNPRHLKRRMFVRGLLELQKGGQRKTKSLRIFSSRFAKYARDYARRMGAQDAKEAQSIYFGTTTANATTAAPPTTSPTPP